MKAEEKVKPIIGKTNFLAWVVLSIFYYSAFSQFDESAKKDLGTIGTVSLIFIPILFSLIFLAYKFRRESLEYKQKKDKRFPDSLPVLQKYGIKILTYISAFFAMFYPFVLFFYWDKMGRPSYILYTIFRDREVVHTINAILVSMLYSALFIVGIHVIIAYIKILKEKIKQRQFHERHQKNNEAQEKKKKIDEQLEIVRQQEKIRTEGERERLELHEEFEQKRRQRQQADQAELNRLHEELDKL